MSGNHRFYRQVTNGSSIPGFHVTKEYRDYVLSLPPEQQVDLIEKVISDMSAARRSYYRRHFPTVRKEDYEVDYPLSHFYDKKHYSFATHRPKYYN